jgi:hypothetical protein
MYVLRNAPQRRLSVQRVVSRSRQAERIGDPAFFHPRPNLHREFHVPPELRLSLATLEYDRGCFSWSIGCLPASVLAFPRVSNSISGKSQWHQTLVYYPPLLASGHGTELLLVGYQGSSPSKRRKGMT